MNCPAGHKGRGTGSCSGASAPAGTARHGAFLSPRWERNQRIARGTFRKVPRDIPREGTRREAVGACTTPPPGQGGHRCGGSPHWILPPGSGGLSETKNGGQAPFQTKKNHQSTAGGRESNTRWPVSHRWFLLQDDRHQCSCQVLALFRRDFVMALGSKQNLRQSLRQRVRVESGSIPA